VAAERDFPAAAGDQPVTATLSAPVPAGSHTVQVRNAGSDWVVVRRFTFDPYVPALAALAKAGPKGCVAWIYRRGGSGAAVAGTVTLTALTAGRWHVTWVDTMSGAVLSESDVTADGGGLKLVTAGVGGDVAMVGRRVD
jgi:hypothetical protein